MSHLRQTRSGGRRRLRVALVAIAAFGLFLPEFASVADARPAAKHLGTASSFGAPALAPPASRPTVYRAGRYIVSFADDPLATYAGTVAGYPATRPARGAKLDAHSANAVRWRARLERTHNAALQRVGAKKIYDYTVVNNGVAVQLTARQAAVLAKTQGVLALEPDRRYQVDTTYSPHFLRLDKPGGLWSQLGGAPNAGAGEVVGVLDTGIWPESGSFRGGTGIPVPADWKGVCETGEHWKASTCNDKIIGARWYVGGFGRKNVAKDDYFSPRDGEGHGSHTASTAAGNYGVKVNIDGNYLGRASGMAPGAKIAAYKVCWTGKPGKAADGCFGSDSVAAINDAVSDGVDVLNYSIGGTSESPIYGSVGIAFLLAARAGVFVANSAGNSGPGASTLDNTEPWVTTVAAATFRRAFQVVALGNGERYVGASTTPSLPEPHPLVTSTSVKLAGASDSDAALCVPGTLDPALATGKVVVCDRGVTSRISKGFEVQRAGGVGLVLVNTSPNSINGDYHPVPAVHLDFAQGNAVKAYIASAGASATAKIVLLTAAELAAAPKVPEVTTFSSRGPSTTTGGDILKPDIAAPGNDVVAAVAPPFNYGRKWDFYSGTSMASPHIAGIGALVKAKHPDWLPSEIRSAIMTSARDTVSSADDPFAQGAGFVDPNPAANPGLVYPTTFTEYVQYLAALGVVTGVPPIAGPELNQPSYAIGSLAGTQTVPRRVRNVGATRAKYTVSASVAGVSVSVSPSSLVLAPGETGSFDVTFSRTSAPLGEWAKGSLTWTDGHHVVRSPVAVRPVAIKAPAEVHGAASESGSQAFTVVSGFTGSLATSVDGLVGVTPTADSVTSGTFETAAPVVDADTKKYPVEVLEGTVAARFSEVSGDPGADLDLYVYKDGDLVALSASSAATEQVTLAAPAAGAYEVYVSGFATPGGSTDFTISNFVVPPGSAGNASVSPDPAGVTQGQPTELTASWTGLDVAKRWFGVINYAGADVRTYFSVG